MSYSDGTYTSLVQDGPPRLSFPLAQDGSNAEMTERDYVILPANFTPTLPTSAITDPDNANAYLVAETTPTYKGGGLLSVSRTFHEIPDPTTIYTTVPLTKPAFPSADFEGYWVDNITSEGTVNVWGIAEPVTVSPYPSGGTFTITYKTSTTAALAYNASDATIKSALEALADVISDGLTVTVTNTLASAGNLRLVWSSSVDYNNLGFDTSSLTPAVVSTVGTVIGLQHNFKAARTAVNVAYPGHGQTGTFDFRYLSGTTGAGVVLEGTRVDDNNFTFANASATAPLTFTHARLFVRTYTPGIARVRGRDVTTYYLPGVSAGITTPEDIPVPTQLSNDNELLLAVCENATGYQNYEADELAIYLGEIYMQAITQIDMADL